MATIEITDPARAVLNQPSPLQPVNLFEIDLALREALTREGGEWGEDRAREAGATAGSLEALEHSQRAERNLPIMRSHDRYGNRIDEVELDPSWHWLLRGAIERQIHGLPWREQTPGAHVVRAALFSLWSNANAGVMCPVSMTYAAVPALRDGAPGLAVEWEPRLTAPDYDAGALAGMAMTERQGGSDVRANITRAEPVGGGVYELHGHKWFCSYPPCDIFLVLAQAPGGLSCFLVERGPGMEFQRLKDKLGTRSLPSSEVEFRAAAGAVGRRGGTRGAGDHPDGQPHASGLPAGRDRQHPPRRAGGGSSRSPPVGVRRAAGRAAGDAQRARGPGDRLRGGDGRARCRVARAYDEPLGGLVPALCHSGDEVLGLQTLRRRTPRRRSSAWAETASSRSPACRCCIATRRSTRSGRARATSRLSTCCAPWPGSPTACPAFISGMRARGLEATPDSMPT